LMENVSAAGHKTVTAARNAVERALAMIRKMRNAGR